MNSFEVDLRRALYSRMFIIAAFAQFIILYCSGYKSGLYYSSIPILCSIPFSDVLIKEEESGFIKVFITRTSCSGYFAGKYLAGIMAGGCSLVLGHMLFSLTKKSGGISFPYGKLFFSGMLWAGVAIMLSGVSKSVYMAYGGSFILYHLLSMLQERHFEDWYCLNPREWLDKQHEWVFGNTGIYLMLGWINIIIFMVYFIIMEKRFRGE